MKEITDTCIIQKKLCLIAKEFHRLMCKHHIPYYMIGGTMLGAVRHNGFIPWDDDMDFGVPRLFYKKCKNVLESELQFPYRFISSQKGRVNYDSSKIEDIDTLIIEIDKRADSDKTGLFIDIFPLDYCNSNWGFFSRNWWIKHLMGINCYKYFWPHSLLHFLIAFVVHVFPDDFFITISYKLLSDKGNYYINYGGIAGKKEIVPKNVFGEPILYEFEDVQFYGVSDSDGYLKCIYGDYMKLPPIEERHTHIKKCFVK